MKPASEALIRSLSRGERLACASGNHRGDPPQGNFYCPSCEAMRCGFCVTGGACIKCRSVVRSAGAILLAAKEAASE